MIKAIEHLGCVTNESTVHGACYIHDRMYQQTLSTKKRQRVETGELGPKEYKNQRREEKNTRLAGKTTSLPVTEMYRRSGE